MTLPEIVSPSIEHPGPQPAEVPLNPPPSTLPAVNDPLGSMIPQVANQSTESLVAPVTVAENWNVSPGDNVRVLADYDAWGEPSLRRRANTPSIARAGSTTSL